MAGTDGGRRSSLLLVSAEPDVGFYASRVPQLPGPVLVLGSGRGRVALGLAERGFTVQGVEPSERMMEVANFILAEQPTDIVARVRLLHADLRSIRLPERFPAVFAPENALGLVRSLGDLDGFLASVLHHLAPGGVFCLDILGPANPGSDVEPQSALEKDGHGLKEPKRPLFRPHLRSRKDAPSRGGAIHRLTLRAFTIEELQGALESHGLHALERYGNFTSKPFAPEDGLQVLVCSRL